MGCGTGRHDSPSLILVTVDTLRADRLACYGRSQAKTPFMDRLAREGTRFTTVVTPVPRTTPAVASLLTGLLPPAHRVRGLNSRLPAEIPSIATWMKAGGARTGAFISNLFLRRGTGFERDFDVFSDPKDRWDGNSAAQVTDEALDWVRGLAGDQRFFLWIHYLDPHWTYDPPAPYDRLYDPDWSDSWPYNGIAAGDKAQGRIIFRNTMTPREVHHAVSLYEGEIASTDAQLGRLLDGLASMGRLDPSLVVLTSDHGESLGEHGYYFAHGEYLYDGTLLVPLILRWPGHVPAGTVSTRMVRLTDIAPTALAMLGLPLPSGLDGRDLSGDLRGPAADPERECWIESDQDFAHSENPRSFVPGIAGKWRGLRGERYKLIFVPRDVSGETGDVELYDILDDPGETRDLSTKRPEITAPLLRRLREYWRRAGAEAGAGEREGAPDVETLRSLGYL
jgi:arylsulfatase A-like enzyme